jgi:hypothetical protein
VMGYIISFVVAPKRSETTVCSQDIGSKVMLRLL